MRKKILQTTMVALLLMPIFAYADTIYSWKGSDGTLRFSNEPPPEGVKAFQTTTSNKTDGDNQLSVDKRRASYDAMVEESAREAERSRQERQAREAAEAAEKERNAEKKRQERIRTEQKRIKQQIEAVKKRAVSPTYPNGMKQAQIDALAKEIEKLNQGEDAANKKPEKKGE